MDSKITKFIVIILFISFKVNAIEFNGKFIQGHFIIGKTNLGKKIFIDEKEVKVSKDGYFAFGIGKDRKFDEVPGQHRVVSWVTMQDNARHADT